MPFLDNTGLARLWAHITARLNLKANLTDIPTAVGDLDNDMGYVTANEIETVSDEDFLVWLNDAGVVTFLSSTSGEIYVTNNNEIYVL